MTRPLRPSAARWARVALAGLVLVGCRDVQQPQAAAGPNDVGGTVVIAQPSEPGTLLPALQSLLIERQITDLLFDRLAEIGDDMNSRSVTGASRSSSRSGGNGRPTHFPSCFTSTRARAGTTGDLCARATCVTASPW